MGNIQTPESISGKPVILRIWERLTNPPAKVPPHLQRQARLLSAFLVTILITGLIYSVLYFWILPKNETALTTIAVWLALLVVYGLCRTGHIVFSAILFVIVFSTGVFIVIIPSNASPNIASLFVFLILPVLIGNIFLNSQQILFLVGLQTLGMLALPFILPNFSLTELLLGVIPFLWMTTAISLIANAHRTQVEQDRQRELAASERFVRATIDALSAHIAVINTTGTIIAVNQAWRAFAANNPPVLSNVHEGANYLAICDGVLPEDPDYGTATEVAAGIRGVLSGQQVDFSVEYFCPSTSVDYWFIVHITRFSGNGPVYAAIAHENITQRKQAEMALKQSENRFRSLFEDVPVAIWEQDFSTIKHYLDGLRENGVVDFRAYFETHPEEVEKCASMIRLLDVNQAALNMFKAPTKAALFEWTMQTMSQAEKEHNHEDFIAIAEGRTTNEWTGADQTYTGEPIEISLSWSVAPYHEKDYAKVFVITRDITELKRAEEDLRFHEAVLRETGQIAKVGGWSFDPLTGDGYWTDEVARIHDMDPHDPTSRTIGLSFYEGKYRAQIEAAIQDAIAHALPYDLELELTTAQGNHKWVRTIGHPVVENGKVVRIRGSFQDITETKWAEAALLESMERFRALFEASPDAILLIDPAQGWIIMDCNTAACQMNGYTREELIGQSIDMLNLAPGNQEERAQYLEQIRETGVFQLETYHRRKDGTIFPVEVSTSLISVIGREIILGIDRDITDRKRAEVALQQSEARLNGVIQSAMDAIISINADQRIVLFNTAAEKMFGWTSEQMLGKTLDPFIPERFRQHHNDHIRAFGETGMTNRNMGALGVIFGRRANGEEFPIEASISQVQMAEGKLYTVILRDVTERSQAEEEIRHLNEDLERRVALRTTQLTQVNAALTQAREEADRANLAKSEFLSRMSHELRTPLNAILGFAQILGMDQLSPHQTGNINHILRAGKHLLGLINEVLDITRIETGKLSLSPEPIRVNEVVSEVLELVETLAARRNIRMEVLTFPAVYIRADRQRLKQVLLNLLSNAIKYNHDEGQVMVDYLTLPNDWLQIRVRDTGPGLSPEKQQRLFVAFDRLGAEKSNIEGTGLGLSLSRWLVEAMGGKLGVDSTPGTGSTFWVELPIVESPMEQSYHPEEGIIDLTPLVESALQHTVLCFEDNLSNMQLIEQIFKHRPSVRLLAAEEGEIGLKAAREQNPDLILLDLNLPDISGYEILHQLKANPKTRHIPVVIVSADATAAQVKRLLDSGAYGYLTNPLEVTQFLQVVDEILARP